MDVRAVDSGVATGRPTGAVPDQVRMIYFSDVKVPDTARARSLHLGMAFKAKIGIPLHQHLGVDRTVGIMADDATFPHGLMFEDKRAGLITMTWRASLVQTGHGQTAGGFHDIHAVGIVALHTAQLAFRHRMMLREVEGCLHFKMTGETGFRVPAGIHDEPAAATPGGDVPAGGAVA